MTERARCYHFRYDWKSTPQQVRCTDFEGHKGACVFEPQPASFAGEVSFRETSVPALFEMGEEE